MSAEYNNAATNPVQTQNTYSSGHVEENTITTSKTLSEITINYNAKEPEAAV